MNSFINYPRDILSWVGFFIWAAFIALFIVNYVKRGPKRKSNFKNILLYSVAAIVTKLLFSLKGFPLHIDWAITPEEVNSDSVILLLSALPWILAGIASGFYCGCLIGFLSGITTALFFTHNYFSILEYTTYALLFAYFVDYGSKSRQFKLLRHPLISISLIALVALPICQYIALFEVSGPFEIRLDNVLSKMWMSLAITILELIFAGLIVEVGYWIFKFKKDDFQDNANFSEKNPLGWFLLTTIPLILYSLIIISTIIWNNARFRVKEDFQKEYNTKVKLIENSLLTIITKNQLLLKDFSRNDLIEISDDERNKLFRKYLYPITHFNQFALFDDSGEFLGGFPITNENELKFTTQEILEIQESMQSFLDSFTLSDTETSEIILTLFHTILDGSGALQGVLIGRTSLTENPVNMFFNSIVEIIVEHGSGLKLVEGNGNELLEIGIIQGIEDEDEYIDIFYPLTLGNWGVQIFIPYEFFLTDVWRRVFLELLTVTIFGLMIFIVLWIRGGRLSVAIKNVAEQTQKISEGKSNKQISSSVPGEIHYLITNLERMRDQFIKKFEHKDYLLDIWQAIGNNANIEEVSKAILNSFLKEDVISVRLIINDDPRFIDRRVSFGLGPYGQNFQYLDNQIVELLYDQKKMFIPNINRIHYFQFRSDYPTPKAIAIFNISNTSKQFALLWIAYNNVKEFSEEEIGESLSIVDQASAVFAFYRLIDDKRIEANQLKAAIDYLQDPILIFANDELLIANRSAEKFVNIDEDFINRTIIEKRIIDNEILRMANSNYESYPTSFDKTFSTGKSYQITIHKNEIKPLGQVTALIFKDKTKEKQHDVMLSDYIKIISHDLRSPLAIMRGYATMLQMVGDLNKKQNDYVTKIVKGVDEATQIIKSLLNQERLDMGYGLLIEEVKAVNLIDKVVEQIILIARQRKVEIIKSGFENINIRLFVDPVLIKQAIYNILHNAVKYSQAHSEVKIELLEENSQLLIKINDSGIGITPVDLPHIFEKYYCARNLKEDNGRVRGGIGLYLVKSIIERHNGRVWVESSLGKGSTFFVLIPTNMKTDGESEVNISVKS